MPKIERKTINQIAFVIPWIQIVNVSYSVHRLGEHLKLLGLGRNLSRRKTKMNFNFFISSAYPLTELLTCKKKNTNKKKEVVVEIRNQLFIQSVY